MKTYKIIRTKSEIMSQAHKMAKGAIRNRKFNGVYRNALAWAISRAYVEAREYIVIREEKTAVEAGQEVRIVRIIDYKIFRGVDYQERFETYIDGQRTPEYDVNGRQVWEMIA